MVLKFNLFLILREVEETREFFSAKGKNLSY